MFLSGLGTATPTTRYTQAQCWDALTASEQLAHLTPRSQAILRKVLKGNNGICSRYLAFDHLSEAFALDPDVLDARFAKHAPVVAAQAATRALADAGMAAGDIDAVIISTCTGYLCPGLTSYVSEQLGLRTDILALDLVGQGCGAALPNMRTGEALIAAGRAGRVLSVCVEICSAAMYLDDDAGVLISACLFGDGAGAAVLTAEPTPGRRRIEWKSAGTLLNPRDRDELRFERRKGMLRNILTPAVPALAAKHVDAVLNECLRHEGLTAADISGWILHAGGREILSAIRQQLNLSEDDTRWSAAILRD
ncbi:MAG: stilbene synthase, partial [Vicinamibacterales bacterium]